MSSYQSPTPIGLQPGINESSRLAPSRDRNSTPKQWQINNRTTEQVRALTGNVRRNRYELQKIQRRALAPSPMHPFKVYNVPPAFCPAKGTYSGNDYDPATDAWRTFRVRIANVGYRPKWFLPDRIGVTGCNFETIMLVIGGSDGNYETVGTDHLTRYVNYDEDNYSLANTETSEMLFVSGDNSSGQPPPITVAGDFSLATFVLPASMQTLTGVLQAALYVQIDGDTDSGTEPLPKIYCHAFSDLPPGFGPQVFPSGANIIPIANLSTPSLGTGAIGIYPQYTVNQLQYNHVLNRYGGFQNMNFRGNWDEDDTLSGQCFYPGDVITLFNGLTMRSQTSSPNDITFQYDSDASHAVLNKSFFRPMVYHADAPAIITARPVFDNDFPTNPWQPLSWFF